MEFSCSLVPEWEGALPNDAVARGFVGHPGQYCILLGIQSEDMSTPGWLALGRWGSFPSRGRICLWGLQGAGGQLHALAGRWGHPV